MADARLHRPAEERHHAELSALELLGRGAPRPAGWKLTPQHVLQFVVGGKAPLPLPGGGAITVTPKFEGAADIVEAAIATLASDRALLLVGPPGTAKSMLSEWLSAAICGSSRLIVQGSAGITEDHVRYSWNYALLLKEGPTESALKPSPVLEAMQQGKLVRLEEMTRCVSEVQDALISVLSEKELAITEMDNRVVAAQRGFNVIATANTADKGVHEMSSALKRRFNFVNVPPVQDLATEVAIVRRRTRELMTDHAVDASVPDELVRSLVTLFSELRAGRSGSRTAVKRVSCEISSAQLISTLFDGALRSAYFGSRTVTARDLGRSIASAFKGDAPGEVGALLENIGLVEAARGSAEPHLLKLVEEIRGHLGEAVRDAR